MIRLSLRPRHTARRWPGIAAGGAALAGLATGFLFLSIAGYDAARAYEVLARESLGTGYGLSETLVMAVPLILAGLAVAIAFRMRLWNIGAEGQLYVGALAAGYVALFVPAPGGARLMLVLAAAVGAGAGWALVPGVLRAWRGVSEILVTLMGTYVAMLLTDHLCYGPWKGSTTYGFPMSDRFPEDASLPTLAGTRLHAGLPIALAVAAIIWALLYRTRWGFQVRVAGSNPRAAEYAGYRIARDTVLVMVLSGSLAGLAGGVEMAGVLHRVQPRFSPGYGYTAILVAWLARLHPLAVPVIALLFGALLTGGEQLQVTLGVPAALVDVLQGLVLLGALAGEVLASYRIVWSAGPALHRPRTHEESSDD
jgi:simple sugar transport system permease protein